MTGRNQTLPARGHHHYRVYGQNLCSSVRLGALTPASFASNDIHFELMWTERDIDSYLRSAQLIARRPTNLGFDLSSYWSQQGYLLAWQDRCAFLLSPDGRNIQCVATRDSNLEWIAASLYGVVLSFALHLRGTANLHASAMAIDGTAVGFMAESGSGKSTLVAACAAKGLPVVTDDVLPIAMGVGEYIVHPGFPFVSLSERAAEAFTPHWHEELDFDHADKLRVPVDGDWARFADAPLPLGHLISIARRDDIQDVDMKRVSPTEAIQTVMQHTNVLPFLPTSLKQAHLAFSCQVVSAIPVWRLEYPSGFQYLDDAIATITDVALTPVR